jgi:hypothetical protein
MEERQFCGLVKFFKNEEFLDQLLDGSFYCNPPEFYRQHDAAGISDHHESCTHAYRQERGDRKATLRIDGKPVDGLRNLTLRSTGINDRWLHCWTCLWAPGDEDALAALANDLTRLRNEFGIHYAFIHPEQVQPFIEHLRTLIPQEVRAAEVQYSDDSLKWSPMCKSEKYRYQREFRFMVGNIPDLSRDPLIIGSEAGFREFIGKNTTISISFNEEKGSHFLMSGPQELVHIKRIEPIP